MNDLIPLEGEILPGEPPEGSLGASPILIDTKGLDVPVIDLAAACGLLRPVEAQPGVYELNPDWFSDPVTMTGDGLTANGPILAGVIAQLIGEASGSSLGIPVKEPGSLGTWYPINKPGTAEPSGLYIVAQTISSDRNAGDTPATVFGIGVRYATTVTLGAEDMKRLTAADGPAKIELSAWGLIPLVAVGGADKVAVVAGQPGHPFTMGFQVAAPDGASLVDAAGLSFQGVRVSAGLAPTASPAVSVSLVVLNLLLPTDLAPKDRTLADLQAITGTELLTTAAALAMAAIGKAVGEKPSLPFLLPALGLGPIVPGEDDVRLPILRWDSFLRLAIAGGDIASPFVDWFTALASDGTLLKAWLQAVGGALGGLTGVEAKVTGDGTRASPFAVPIFAPAAVGTLSLTAGSVIDADGRRHFYPGLAFAAKPVPLGTSGVAVLGAADLELLDFTLATTAAETVTRAALSIRPGLFHAGIRLSGAKPGDPLFSGTIDGGTYTFGALTAGMEATLGATGMTIQPAFTLTGIKTPKHEYPSIDLTRPGDLVEAAAAELADVLEKTFNKLFGLEAGNNAGLSLAALLGVTPPPTDGAVWPAELVPPFSLKGIPDFIQDPIAAFGTYYAALIRGEVPVDGKPPFFYMVQALGTLLLQAGGVAGGITGDGTPDTPWAMSIGVEDSPASILAYVTLPDGDAPRRLVLGIGVAVDLPLAGNALAFTARLEVLGLDAGAAKGTGILGAQILPGIGARLAFKDGLKTPPVAGAQLELGAGALSLFWSPYSSWTWSMVAAAPALIVDGEREPVGTDMNYSDATDLGNLIRDQARTFGAILTGVLGVALYRAGERGGLALNGWFGLLPKLGPFVPKGIDWPEHMPVLRPTSFDNPIGQVRNQLRDVMAEPARAVAALGLLGWAIDGKTEDAAPVPGNGTQADPYRVALGLPWDIAGSVWQDTDRTVVAPGFSTHRVFTLAGVTATTAVHLEPLALSWATGRPVSDAGLPRVSVQTVLSFAEDTPVPGLSGATVTLGVVLRLDTRTGAFSAAPIVEATAGGTRLTFRHDPDAQHLGAADDDLMALVNTGIAEAAKALSGNETFQRIYATLTELGLAVPVAGAGDPYGIDPGGWRALLSDPLGFLTGRALAILADPTIRDGFFAAIADTLGFSLPTIPEPLLALLAGLRITTDAAHGYALDPRAVVAVFREPAIELPARLKALIEDPAARSAVIAALARGFESVPIGPFNLTIENGRVVTVTLPRGGIDIGSFLEPSLTARVDLESGALSAALDLYLPDAGFSVAASLAYTIGGPVPVPGLALVWGDGTMPALKPLTIIPFNASEFIDQLAGSAPVYVLSTFVTQAVDSVLLAKYPLARSLLQVFGLAAPDPETEIWHMKSPLGLFQDPIGWMLSDAVVGRDGRLNIVALRDVLKGLPPGTAAGLTLAGLPNGARLTGLPYGLELAVTADPGSGLFTVTPSLGQPLPLVGGVELEDLSFSLSLTADYQPGIAGAGKLTAAIPGLPERLFLSGGYDKDFSLVLGENGEGNPTLSLVPFGGWQTFALGIGTQVAQTALANLSDTLLTALEKRGDAKLTAFVKDMRSLVVTLEVDALVKALLAAQRDQPPPAPPLGQRLEEAALSWLADRLKPENARKTVDAAATLLALALDGVTGKDGLITYAPSRSVPIQILAGVRTVGEAQVMGIWATMAVSAFDRIFVTLSPTGIGISLADFGADGRLLAPPAPIISFGLTAQAAVAGKQGPGLSLGYENGTVIAGFDPMMEFDQASGSSTLSPLARHLLPVLFDIPPDRVNYRDDLEKAVSTWLLDVLKIALPHYVSVVVLNTQAVKTWLDEDFTKTVPLKPGVLLTESKLLVRDPDTKSYALATLDELEKVGVAGFLAGFLKALTRTRVKVFSFTTGGGIWLEPGPGADDFGIRFAVTGLSLKSVPWLVFQLGDPNKEWITLAGGEQTKALEPGIAAYVPLDGLTPKFGQIKLHLVNIGVDFQGKAGQPLVNLSRFRLGKIAPRGLVTFDFGAANKVRAYGGGVNLEDIAISLAPNTLATGPKANPVAQNLLGSGDKPDSGAAPTNPAANPAFSARAGWVSDGSLGVELYDANGSSKTRLWFPVQRDFGPVHANKIGLGWENKTHIGSFLFDGGLTLAGLSIELVDLAIGVNVTNITDYSQYSLDLGGLAVSFKGGAVQLEGGLLRQNDPLRYDGQLLVKAGTFTIYAVGSFALIPVDPGKPEGTKAVSFFVFLNLNAPLGGVPAFFVMGIAGGFSVNRNIKVPDAGDILSFPLIQGVLPANPFKPGDTPAEALGKLSKVVYPEIGTYWAAAGLKFSSFQLLDVFAMLLVKFGREFEIDIIGVASASMPPKTPPSKALAYVELGIVASFKFDLGEISVTAQLTPNSFLLAKDCKLTGGFAAKFWFGPNPNAGNFVITLGGYHPAFEPPDFYPKVPRLGFDWPVLNTSSVSLGVSGGSYFALTPSMIMAGAFLKALFKAGPIKAWFDAAADFLISWQPFYFRAGVRISVGISFGFEIFGVSVTLSAELGAGLELWGPPTAGRVNVNWYIVSFSIPFGDQNQTSPSTKPLDWAEFEKRMLPRTESAPAGVLQAIGAEPEKPVVLVIDISDGLLGKELDPATGPAVRNAPFTLSVRSAIPASPVTIRKSDFSAASPKLGITPMNLPDVETPLVLALTRKISASEWQDVPVGVPGLTAAKTSEPAVSAVWSPLPFNPNGKPAAKTMDGTVFGAVIQGTSDRIVDPLKVMDLLKAFGHERSKALPLPFSRTPKYRRPPAMSQDNRFKHLMETVMAEDTARTRAAIMQAVENRQVAVIVDPNLTVLAKFADQIYQAAPSFAHIGFDLADSAMALPAASPRRARLATPEPEPDSPPRLLGMTQNHGLPGPLRAHEDAPLSVHLPTPRSIARWFDIEAPAGRRLTAAAEGAAALTVRPGTVAVLSTGLGRGTPRLGLDGLGLDGPGLDGPGLDSGAPLRVYAFDEAGRILSDRRLSNRRPGREATGMALPEDTHQVVLVGLDDDAEDAPPVAGWSTRSTLIQVGHHTLLASGCTVRPQASPRTFRAMREKVRGPMDAAVMLRHNRVQNGPDHTKPGWVETVFGHAVGTVAVVLARQDDRHADPHVRIAATASPWDVDYGEAANPVHRIDAADGTILLYAAPSAEDARHAVLVRGFHGLAGVYGFAGSPDQTAAAWGGHDLPVPGAASARARRLSPRAAVRAHVTRDL